MLEFEHPSMKKMRRWNHQLEQSKPEAIGNHIPIHLQTQFNTIQNPNHQTHHNPTIQISTNRFKTNAKTLTENPKLKTHLFSEKRHNWQEQAE